MRKAYGKNELHFRLGNTAEAVALVKKYHYSHRAPASVQLVGTFHTEGGLFGDFGPAVAAVFFSIPPSRWAEEVHELSRLVCSDGCQVPLSRLIGLACQYMRAHGSDLLVSFADSTQHHHGGIYQACSWNYNGKRAVFKDGIFVNGTYCPRRTASCRYGTHSVRILTEQHPDWTIEPHYDDGKHLYWRALNKAGKAKAERLGLKSLPYPKPDKEGEK